MCLAIPRKIQSIEHFYGGTIKMAGVFLGSIFKEMIGNNFHIHNS